MTKQLSFTKYEHEILPEYRQNLNKAESTEDVKKFFVYTVRELFKNIFEDKIDFEYDDISLMPDSKVNYKMSERLVSTEAFASLWSDSDLPHLIARLAESAMNRYNHLEKHQEKTDAKIRM
ncbi:MAG: hypothetical protein JW786_09115 [Desulfobacterales bacterium]|nr:hypothetical protein [Desulfobacterales bacterium]